MDGRFMRRFALSPLNVMLVLMLTAVAPQQAFGPPPTQAGQAPAAQSREHSARPVPAARRVRGHAVGRVADAAQPDQHRHRSRRPHLGGRRCSLSLPSCPSARRRSHRRAAGHRWGRQGRQDAYVRAGAWPDRAARRRGHRQQGDRLAAARPHRLHRRRSQPALRSGGGQTRSAADRLPGHQSRPLAAFGDRSVPTASGSSTPATPAGCSPTSLERRSGSSGPIGRTRSDRSSSRTTPRSTPASRATTGMCMWADSRCE